MQESCESSGLHILAEDAKIRLSSEHEVETRCRASDGKDRIFAADLGCFEQLPSGSDVSDVSDVSLAPGRAHCDDVTL